MPVCSGARDLRAQSAPGSPCALSSREGQRISKAQAESRRENENACPVIASEAKQSSLLCCGKEAGLLRRGACHRARIRAIRWLLAMTDWLPAKPGNVSPASVGQRLDATPPISRMTEPVFAPLYSYTPLPLSSNPIQSRAKPRRGGSETMARAEALQRDLASIDVSDPLIYQNDSWHQLFARLRREDPVHYCETSPFGPYWSVTRYDDIFAVELDHENYSSASELRDIQVADQPKGLDRPNFIRMAPPGHTAHPRTVAPIVAPSNLANFEQLIRKRTCDVLDVL